MLLFGGMKCHRSLSIKAGHFRFFGIAGTKLNSGTVLPKSAQPSSWNVLYDEKISPHRRMTVGKVPPEKILNLHCEFFNLCVKITDYVDHNNHDAFHDEFLSGIICLSDRYEFDRSRHIRLQSTYILFDYTWTLSRILGVFRRKSLQKKNVHLGMYTRIDHNWVILSRDNIKK